MNVRLLQTDIRWESPEANRKHFDTLIDRLPLTDLIVLPEMFTTGFTLTPGKIASKEGHDTLKWMRETTARTGTALGGSIAVEESGEYYNRFYFVMPDGTYHYYNKRHLFTYGGENRQYTPGRERVIVEHCGFRILLQICYDLRFPVFSRCTGNYDMIIYVANWPVSRIGVWNTLLRARAIENQCYVAGVNRTGSDPSNYYNGCSLVIDYLGNTVADAGAGGETALAATVAIEPLNDFRRKFPALEDADPFVLLC